MSLLKELKRRNVFKVAIAYLAAAWLLIQIVETTFPVFGISDAGIRLTIVVLLIGFPLVVIFSWLYELTPDGLKLERDIDRGNSIARHTGKKLDRGIIAVLTLALGFFAIDKFVLDPARDAAREREVAERARTDAIVGSFGDKSIAVLPFFNMSSDPEQAFFSDGITEELLNLLAKIPQLRVISRSSSFQFRGDALDLPEVAAQLNVAHILEGSVRKAGDQIRITVQLIEAESDFHLWSQTYDRKLEDIFAIQDEVAATIVEQLKITMSVELPKAERHNPEAYPLYVQAKQIIQLDDPDRIDRAEELLRRVLEIEPYYVDAELALAIVYHRQARTAFFKNDVALMESLYAERESILQDVAAKDPGNANLNAQLGWDAMFGRNDNIEAAHRIEAAIEAEPRNYDSLLPAMVLSNGLGRLDLAIGIGEYLTSRDPMGFWAHANLADAYLKSGQTERAIATYRTAAAISPKAGAIQWKLGAALLMNGQPDEALLQFEREEGRSYQLHGMALALNDLGEHDASSAALTALHAHENSQMEKNPDHTGWQFGFARAYAWLGNADRAFQYLDNAIQEEPGALVRIADNPYFVKINEDPRWQPLVDQVDQRTSIIEFNPKLPPEILAGNAN